MCSFVSSNIVVTLTKLMFVSIVGNSLRHAVGSFSLQFFQYHQILSSVF